MKKKPCIKLLSLALCILCTFSALVGCTDLDSGTSTDKATQNTDVTAQTGTDTTAQTQASDAVTTQKPENTQKPDKTDVPVTTQKPSGTEKPSEGIPIDQISIPEYSGDAFIPLINNEPLFTSDDWVTRSFESYGELDSLGRCTQVYACIGRDLMPTDERGSIGSVKPSGWQTVKYDIVDGKYLYNRCHLIGWQLTGENANTKNLITGTRYLNIEGMLPFENMVADYIKETGNHVLYRVTPVFDGSDLVAKGVIMEGWSVEDNGEGICFCVFAYNVQPGIEINYANGDSKLEENKPAETQPAPDPDVFTYILNTNTKKFHYESCSSAKQIADKNKKTYTGTRDELIEDGYSPCGNCKP